MNALATIPDTASAQDCFVLKAGGAAFGVPVESVQTIFRIPALSPVPLGPSIVAGLVNLRGKVVTAVSLSSRLGLRPEGPAPLPRAGSLAVAIEHEGEVFALLVDEVGDVLACHGAMRVAAPAHVGIERARLTRAYFRTSSGILPLLDLNALFEIRTDGHTTDAHPFGPGKGEMT